MDLKEIQNLIKFVSNSGVAEVKLEMDDVKITIKTTVEKVYWGIMKKVYELRLQIASKKGFAMA